MDQITTAALFLSRTTLRWMRSMGNESGWGENLEIAGRWVTEYDPSRLLHYENIAPYKKDTTPDFSMLDLYSRMYAPTQEVDQFFACLLYTSRCV